MREGINDYKCEGFYDVCVYTVYIRCKQTSSHCHTFIDCLGRPSELVMNEACKNR